MIQVRKGSSLGKVMVWSGPSSSSSWGGVSSLSSSSLPSCVSVLVVALALALVAALAAASAVSTASCLLKPIIYINQIERSIQVE